MEMRDFERFSETIRNADLSNDIPPELLLRKSESLATFYAPFDYVNQNAKIIICGITPGLQQAMLALREAKSKLLAGYSVDQAALAAKNTASFGGPMRANLINMLDYIGTPKLLKIEHSATLFAEHSHLVHYTSALRYPVFIGGKNYNGTPKMTRHPDLVWQLREHLAEELRILKDAIIVPLGPKVEEGLEQLVRSGELSEDRVLYGMPHPSGANAERIAFFLDKKREHTLSKKTNANKIKRSRQLLLDKINLLSDY